MRSYFGTGTQLQEMYITPSLLERCGLGHDRRVRALVARQRRHARGHALGRRRPGQLEVYGWAAWSPGGATLTLRNPADHAQSIAIDPAVVFELPERAPKSYTLRSPWRSDRGRPAVTMRAGTARTIELEAFQVINLTTDAR